MVRSPRDRMSWTACSTVSSSPTACGFGVMKSRAMTPSSAFVSTRARTMSDREMIPTRVFPFTTGIARKPAEIIFSAASGSGVSGVISGGTCITVETFVAGGKFRPRISSLIVTTPVTFFRSRIGISWMSFDFIFPKMSPIVSSGTPVTRSVDMKSETRRSWTLFRFMWNPPWRDAIAGQRIRKFFQNFGGPRPDAGGRARPVSGPRPRRLLPRAVCGQGRGAWTRRVRAEFAGRKRRSALRRGSLRDRGLHRVEQDLAAVRPGRNGRGGLDGTETRAPRIPRSALGQARARSPLGCALSIEVEPIRSFGQIVMDRPRVRFGEDAGLDPCFRLARHRRGAEDRAGPSRIIDIVGLQEESRPPFERLRHDVLFRENRRNEPVV